MHNPENPSNSGQIEERAAYYSSAGFDGSALKQKRRERKLTQQDIAEKTGLSRNQVIAMEKGTFTGGVKYLLRYLEFLNMKIQLIDNIRSFPQLEELADLFREDDE